MVNTLSSYKDRLVGTSACRITLATKGVSQPDLFWQTGTLHVQPIRPNINETELNDCNVNPIFLIGTDGT